MNELLSFPFPRTEALRPPQEYAELRGKCPVAHTKLETDQDAWILTKYDDVKELLLSREVSVDRSKPGFPVMSEAQRVARRRSILHMDGTQHALHRKLISKYFTVARMNDRRAEMRAVIERHFEAMISKPGPADFVADFALPVPSELICMVLDIPYDDHEFFEVRTAITTDHSASPELVEAAEIELRDYIADVVKARAINPGDDLISNLLVAAGEAGIGIDEVTALSHLILVAGHETSANALALSQLLIFSDEEKVRVLREDPSLIPNAVEELLRFTSVAQYMSQRATVGEVTIGDTTIPSESAVFALLLAANHDPEKFENPDELDIRRADARQHVAFGFGAHQCLGQHFARVEMEEAFKLLLEHPKRLELAVAPSEVEYKFNSFVFGLRHLPVTAVDR